MNNIRLPGAFWVALIAGAMIVLQEYVQDPIYYQIGLAIVMAVLKAFNLETSQVKKVVEEIEKEMGKEMPRSAMLRMEVEHEPNRLMTWFLG